MGIGKKGALLLGIFLLIINVVSATIQVEDVPASAYNIGDKLVVSGSVAQATALRGYLGIGFVCGTKKVQITSLFMDLKAGEAQAFSQLITIPQSLEGECTAQVTLSDGNGNLIETKNAGVLTITSALEGGFQEVPASFQLGDKLLIKGQVTKQDKSSVEGLATIYFKQNQEAVFVETTPIVQGVVSYQKDLNLVPAGSYALDIAVADTFGNKNFFADSYRFSINNNIDFDMTLDKKVYSPGETATLSGLVKSTVQSRLTNVDVELLVNAKAQQQKLEDSTKPFLFKFTVDRDMKTGDHVVRVSAKDATGNFGEKELPFSVQARPTVLGLKVAQDAIVPEQNIVFDVTLADQAGDPMRESVVAKLYNQKGEFEKSKLVQTQSQDFFVVPQGGLPGIWKIELEGLGLTSAKTFVVKEQKALRVQLDGETLFIQNTGNVRYDEYFAVKANEKEGGKKLRLGLQDETKILLSQLFDPGTYTIYIPLTDQKFEAVTIQEEPGFFTNVASSFSDVTGNVVANANLPERKTGLVVLFVVVLISLAVVLKPRGGGSQRLEVRQPKQGLRDYLVARKRAKELRQARGGSDGRGYKHEFGRADEQDVADFRQRMQKVWDEHQEKEEREKYQRSGYSGYARQSSPSPSQKADDATKSEGNIFDIFK